MTTFEHAMVGIVGGLAAGIHRPYGWPIIAAAGIAAISPDWDGLTLLLGTKAFDTYHRVLGHNFLVAGLLATVIGIVEYQFRLSRHGVGWLRKIVTLPDGLEETPSRGHLVNWIFVAIIAAYSHLAADIVVSGGDGLSDWELQLLWPFSDRGFVLPLVAWGDPTVSIIFAVAMLAMLKWREHVRMIACLCLLCVAAYILRGVI
jgi:membrane-bound metal-dependent hydrolase YbcI (DUF457 family)